jgi:hypothetical protein
VSHRTYIIPSRYCEPLPPPSFVNVCPLDLRAFSVPHEVLRQVDRKYIFIWCSLPKSTLACSEETSNPLLLWDAGFSWRLIGVYEEAMSLTIEAWVVAEREENGQDDLRMNRPCNSNDGRRRLDMHDQYPAHKSRKISD